MSWAKTNNSTRSLLFTVAILGLTTAGLWIGAQFNSAEASTSSAVTAPSATFAADTASLGAIPDRGVTGCSDADPSTSKSVTFAVSGITGTVNNVGIQNLTFGGPIHTWVGDVKAILIAPNGASHVIFGRTGETTATGCADSSDLAGPYAFSDSATAPPGGGWWQAATTAGATTALPTGTYRTTALGGAGATNPSPATNMNAAFTGVTNANGTWTLRFTDHAGGDTGAVSAATLLVEGGTPPIVTDANVDMDGDGDTDYVVARGTDTPLADESKSVSNASIGKGTYTIRERLAKDREARATGTTTNNLAPGIAWYTSNNGTNAFSAAQFGDAATDFLVPNDYDGDGKDDIAVWRPGAPFQAAFYILQSSNLTVRTDIFGVEGDDPAITGDYDGDGKDDTATFRCPTGTAGQCYFFYRPSGTPNAGIYVVAWGYGVDGDFFVNPGDFDGDGKADFCLQRANPAAPTQGQFILLRSSDFGVEYINWGNSSDFILPGDYDGDGKSDFCVRRTVSNQRFHYILERDGGGTGANGIAWGVAGDVSAPGDYDRDGKQDIAVWRPNSDPTQNFFYVRRSTDSGVSAYEWGASGDVPAASWYVH